MYLQIYSYWRWNTFDIFCTYELCFIAGVANQSIVVLDPFKVIRSIDIGITHLTETISNEIDNINNSRYNEFFGRVVVRDSNQVTSPNHASSKLQ